VHFATGKRGVLTDNNFVLHAFIKIFMMRMIEKMFPEFQRYLDAYADHWEMV
jgi:hypothetical protein